jgi:uncharacterized protein (DUF779 family)
MNDAWLAHVSADPTRRAREVAQAHAAFLAGGPLAGSGLRDVVAQSWLRSAQADVNPDADPLVTLADHELASYRAGGCCDGNAPMCYPEGEFRTGASDVLLAELRVEGVPEAVTFWMSGVQFDRWRHTHLTVDVVLGRGSGFSLEAPEGVRFLIRSRLLTAAENAALGQ